MIVTPIPYYMCSKGEVDERLESREISLWEKDKDEASFDPVRVIKKYRRSAAGSHQSVPRTMDQLEYTVDYLIREVIVLQTSASGKRLPFHSAVAFFEDRVRAVQKDMTISQTFSAKISLKLISAHLLTLYLMAESAEYQTRFGEIALQTAFSSYWQAREGDSDTDDYVLGLEILWIVRKSFLEISTKLASLHALYRNRKQTDGTTTTQDYVQWTLDVVSNILLQNWRNTLFLLASRKDKFGILARNILGPAVPRIVWNALEAYNISFMKLQKVEINELCRLLAFGESNSQVHLVTEFCANAGLPLVENRVVFKDVAIKSVSMTTRWNDEYILNCTDFESDPDGLLLPQREWLRWFLL